MYPNHAAYPSGFAPFGYFPTPPPGLTLPPHIPWSAPTAQPGFPMPQPGFPMPPFNQWSASAAQPGFHMPPFIPCSVPLGPPQGKSSIDIQLEEKNLELVTLQTT